MTPYTLFLYVSAVLIWGSTWIMMKFQLGVVAPAASLTYRYLAAGVLILIGAALFGKVIRLTARQHLWCALQGALMFSVNYWLTYLAAVHLTTGIVSIFFAGAAGMTMFLSCVVYRRLPEARPVIGALLGIIGIALVFWPEVQGLALDGPEFTSGMLVTLSVMLFSAGGLIGARNMGSGMPRYATLGWAMVWGAGWMAIVVLLRGESFDFEWTHRYVWSLVWVTLLGSLLVFVLYFAVIERIGAEKASYATVMFPLVALVVSTFVEDYQWPGLALVGVPLALVGNALVLYQGRASPSPAQGPPGEAEPVEWPVNFVELPEGDALVAQHGTQHPLGP